MAPLVDAKYREEIEKARTEVQNLITKEKFSALNLLRLAYASQFSIANSHYDAPGTTTSTGATTNTTQSANNNNLKAAIENIKVKHPTITYPDLYQLAGVVAVEALDGPIIEFVPGRKDSSVSPDEACLPDGKQNLRDVFHRVEISDPKHIVALCGGLELVRSGIQGPRTGEETLKFDNSYFVELVNKRGSSLNDKDLLDYPEFRSCVQLYAKNKEAFFRDYEEAHKKLSELGLPHSSFFRLTLEKSTSVVKNMHVTTQRAVGAAVAAAVVILSVFYLINRRRAKHSLQQFP
ncbi:hypothetical protein HAX54_012214 [Datura stramonium]|uniref:Plant heme peroxidase family profile domain-containing protein n=1 Tax=Datura stramonium TaxID=4076 RepID=A0ABS8TL82_DATST|nr:hypothetical protein [Datura stramonium]